MDYLSGWYKLFDGCRKMWIWYSRNYTNKNFNGSLYLIQNHWMSKFWPVFMPFSSWSWMSNFYVIMSTSWWNEPIYSYDHVSLSSIHNFLSVWLNLHCRTTLERRLMLRTCLLSCSVIKPLWMVGAARSWTVALMITFLCFTVTMGVLGSLVSFRTCHSFIVFFREF